LQATVYLLRELAQDGSVLTEAFQAPSDEVAVSRALDVSDADIVEIWRDRQLVARIDRGSCPARPPSLAAT
jgi:hypothetical protein